MSWFTKPEPPRVTARMVAEEVIHDADRLESAVIQAYWKAHRGLESYARNRGDAAALSDHLLDIYTLLQPYATDPAVKP